MEPSLAGDDISSIRPLDLNNSSRKEAAMPSELVSWIVSLLCSSLLNADGDPYPPPPK